MVQKLFYLNNRFNMLSTLQTPPLCSCFLFKNPFKKCKNYPKLSPQFKNIKESLSTELFLLNNGSGKTSVHETAVNILLTRDQSTITFINVKASLEIYFQQKYMQNWQNKLKNKVHPLICSFECDVCA